MFEVTPGGWLVLVVIVLLFLAIAAMPTIDGGDDER